MSLFTKLGNDIASPVDAAGNRRSVDNVDFQRWMTEVERMFSAFQAGGGVIFPTFAAANASLGYGPNQMAWVFGDPVPGNNGVYRKVGASGAGSWVRMGDLPFSFIAATNAGAGTENAIVATTAIPIPVADGAALISLNIAADNTGSPVAVSFNGAAPLVVKTISGGDIPIGGLTAGMRVDGYKIGSTFQLRTDLASAALVETALDAADRAVAAASAVTGAPQWAFASKAAAALFNPVVAPDFISLTGSSGTNGVGRPELFEVLPPATPDPSDLPAAAYVRLTDGSLARWRGREFPIEIGAKGDGLTDNTNFFDDFSATMTNFGGVISADRGVFRTTKPFRLPPGFNLQGAGADKTVFDLSLVDSMGGQVGLINCDQSSYLTPLPGLAADITYRTVIPMLDASGIEEGDWILIYNPTDYSWLSTRSSYRAGEWVRVSRIVGNDIIPSEPLWHLYDAADVDIYLHRGPQVIARDFSIRGAYLETECLFVDTAISPIIENVRTYGTKYAGIRLQRVMEPYVRCNLFQLWDTVAVANEYALVMSAVHGGEIHGNYHAQRHGIAFGNAPFIGCVPNRKTRTYANTSSPDAIGSLDLGHGCSEGLEIIGGKQAGITLGGARHRIIGSTVGQAEGQGYVTIAGMVMSGSEFRGGDFIFEGVKFRSMANATASSVGPINLTLNDSCVEPARFIFNGCTFISEAANQYFLRLIKNNCPTDPSLIVRNPFIDDAGGTFSYFSWLTNVAGGVNWKEVVLTDVAGLEGTVRRLVISGGVTASRWKFDPQFGVYAIAGDTGASQVNQPITFPYAYPVAPYTTAYAKTALVGGKRVVVAATGQTASAVSVNVATLDVANFASTAIGNIGWRAEFL